MANSAKTYKEESHLAYQLLDMFDLKHFLQSIPKCRIARVLMALHRDLNNVLITLSIILVRNCGQTRGPLPTSKATAS